MTPPIGQHPSSYPFCASRTARRMKSASVIFLKNPLAATEVRLRVGRWAIMLSASSVAGVWSVKKGSVMLVPRDRVYYLKVTVTPSAVGGRHGKLGFLAFNKYLTATVHHLVLSGR